MRTFKINGKTYTAKKFGYNTLCDLEDMGVSLEKMVQKPMSAVRAYFALHLGNDQELAGEEIENHIIAGGTFEDLIDVMNAEMEDSGFFRALNNETTEENAAENTEKVTEKKRNTKA